MYLEMYSPKERFLVYQSGEIPDHSETYEALTKADEHKEILEKKGDINKTTAAVTKAQKKLTETNSKLSHLSEAAQAAITTPLTALQTAITTFQGDSAKSQGYLDAITAMKLALSRHVEGSAAIEFKNAQTPEFQKIALGKMLYTRGMPLKITNGNVENVATPLGIVTPNTEKLTAVLNTLKATQNANTDKDYYLIPSADGKTFTRIETRNTNPLSEALDVQKAIHTLKTTPETNIMKNLHIATQEKNIVPGKIADQEAAVAKITAWIDANLMPIDQTKKNTIIAAWTAENPWPDPSTPMYLNQNGRLMETSKTDEGLQTQWENASENVETVDATIEEALNKPENKGGMKGLAVSLFGNSITNFLKAPGFLGDMFRSWFGINKEGGPQITDEQLENLKLYEESDLKNPEVQKHLLISKTIEENTLKNLNLGAHFDIEDSKHQKEAYDEWREGKDADGKELYNDLKTFLIDTNNKLPSDFFFTLGEINALRKLPNTEQKALEATLKTATTAAKMREVIESALLGKDVFGTIDPSGRPLANELLSSFPGTDISSMGETNKKSFFLHAKSASQRVAIMKFLDDNSISDSMRGFLQKNGTKIQEFIKQGADWAKELNVPGGNKLQIEQLIKRDSSGEVLFLKEGLPDNISYTTNGDALEIHWDTTGMREKLWRLTPWGRK